MGEKMTLPPGWTIEKGDKSLPPGWTISSEKKKLNTPTERDNDKLRKLSGAFQVEEKTPEELKKMSVSEKLQYAEDLRLQREHVRSQIIVPRLASGLTFGASRSIEALKPVEFEETSPYSIMGTGAEVGASLVPLSGLTKVFAGPALKLATKSPILQKQLSSLATMFGVGMADEALHEIGRGEMPSAGDVLEHGVEWAALDGLLQAAGSSGRFAKGLLMRSKATGLPRTQLVNDLNRELLESGVDMTNAEAVSNAALDILSRPVTEAEINAARRLSLPAKEESPISELSQEILQQKPITPKDLKTRKIEDSEINRLTNDIVNKAETMPLEKVVFTKEAEALERNAIQEQIDSVGTRAASEEELGNTIREQIEGNLEARKSEYRPLYAQAEEAAGVMSHVPQNTAHEAGDRFLKISRLRTRPSGYSATLSTLENVLEDAGFVIQRNEKGVIQEIVSSKEVPIENTIELARRLNEMVDYEAIEPTIKETLRGVARAAKKDIRNGLASNPEALAAFELAEQAHAETASRFGRESVRKIRGQQAGEKISKMAESPTSMGELKEVLTPEQFLTLEREMLEKLNNQTFEKAETTFRNIQRHLSEDTRKLAKEIVESKNPHNPSVRKKLVQESILNDMSNAVTTGTRPDKVLNMWRTPKGQKLVKETFHNSPNWPRVKDYLENQSFNDMVDTVLKDGKLDIKKFNDFMKDPAQLNNIRSQGGEEAVLFFRNMDSHVKNLEKNTRLLERFPKKQDVERGKELLRKTKEKASVKPKETGIAEESLKLQRSISKGSKGTQGQKILERMVSKDFPIQAKGKKWKDWFAETMGLTPTGFMSVFGLMKLGLPNTVATLIGYRIMNKLLTSNRARRAFSEAAKSYINPLPFIVSIDKLGGTLDEE